MSSHLVLQAEQAECALACLAMIASANGYHADLADLRRRFPISLKGATLAQLIRHAESLAFAARPLRLQLEGLKDLRGPGILRRGPNQSAVALHSDPGSIDT